MKYILFQVLFNFCITDLYLLEHYRNIMSHARSFSPTKIVSDYFTNSRNDGKDHLHGPLKEIYEEDTEHQKSSIKQFVQAQQIFSQRAQKLVKNNLKIKMSQILQQNQVIQLNNTISKCDPMVSLKRQYNSQIERRNKIIDIINSNIAGSEQYPIRPSLTNIILKRNSSLNQPQVTQIYCIWDNSQTQDIQDENSKHSKNDDFPIMKFDFPSNNFSGQNDNEYLRNNIKLKQITSKIINNRDFDNSQRDKKDSIVISKHFEIKNEINSSINISNLQNSSNISRKHLKEDSILVRNTNKLKESKVSQTNQIPIFSRFHSAYEKSNTIINQLQSSEAQNNKLENTIDRYKQNVSQIQQLLFHKKYSRNGPTDDYQNSEVIRNEYIKNYSPSNFQRARSNESEIKEIKNMVIQIKMQIDQLTQKIQKYPIFGNISQSPIGKVYSAHKNNMVLSPKSKKRQKKIPNIQAKPKKNYNQNRFLETMRRLEKLKQRINSKMKLQNIPSTQLTQNNQLYSHEKIDLDYLSFPTFQKLPNSLSNLQNNKRRMYYSPPLTGSRIRQKYDMKSFHSPQKLSFQ